MARARRPEGITEDEHRVLHGELEEAGAVGGAVGGGRWYRGRIGGRVVAARAPGSRPGSSAMTSNPDLRVTSAGPVPNRAERALRSLTDSVTRLPDTEDGRPLLQAVVGSGCLGINAHTPGWYCSRSGQRSPPRNVHPSTFSRTM